MSPVAALEITDDMYQGKVVDLGDATLILQDPDNAFTPETAIRRMSMPDYQSGSLTPSVNQYWLYIPLTNYLQHEQWIVRSGALLFDRLDFYLYCEGQALQYTPQPPLGLHSPTFANQYLMSVTLPYNTQCGLLQHAVGFASVVKTQLVVPTVATRQSTWVVVLNLMGIGAIASLIIYNFLLYVSVRNSTYFFYTVYACLHLILMVAVNLKPPELIDLFATSHQALRVLSSCVMISAIIFTLRFMWPGIVSARQNPVKPILSRMLSVLVALCWVALSVMLLSLLYGLIFPEHLSYTVQVNSLFYLLFSALIPALSLVVALSGYKPAWVFLPAWTILLTAHIGGTLNLLGVVGLQSTMPTIIILAAALEMVLLSIALGMNLRDSQLARDRAQIARANAELRMQQQEKFVSTLSHEIRTPLHAMLGSTTLLGRTPLSDKQKDYWKTTHYAAESMYELVDNLLDRTQAKQAKVTDKNTVFEPQRLLESMIRLLRSRAEEKSLSLCLHTESLPHYLQGNPVILRRALINLISNAVKYTDAGEIIVMANWDAEDSALHVTIQDTGQGMTPQQLSRIHESFNMGVEALYSQQSSSGLGLPICFEMVNEAGGQLQLDSQLNQGTTVHFSLPMRVAAAPDDQVTAAATTEREADMALAVLVVDDLETNRLVARDLLESAGHHVTTAASGKQALALLREQAFDAVLSDTRMPEMDGMQLLAALRRKYSPEDLTIVMTSGHFGQQQQEAFMALGATACLPKPHSPEALLSAIQGKTPDRHLPQPSPPPASTHRPLDATTTAHLHALYKQQLQEDITRIHQAVDRQDAETIRIAAHRIVSASRALGLHSQAEAALQIETWHEEQAEPDWDAFGQLVTRQTGQLAELLCAQS